MENDLDNMQLLLEFTGELQIWDQQGGYDDPTVLIGGDSLTGALQDYFNKELELGKYGEPGGQIKGVYKITVHKTG